MADESHRPEKPELPSDEDIQARFAKIREDLHAMDLPELPETEFAHLQATSAIPDIENDDLEAKLSDIERRAGAARAGFDRKILNMPDKASEQSQRTARGLGLALTIAYILMGLPLFFIFVGWLLDRRLHTGLLMGLGAVAGAALGIVLAVRMVNQTDKRT